MDLAAESLNNVKQAKINIYLFAYLYIYSYLCIVKETKKKLKQEEMRDYLEEIPEETWEYVESWFQFNNNQKQTVMDKERVEIEIVKMHENYYHGIVEFSKKKIEERLQFCGELSEVIEKLKDWEEYIINYLD